MTSPQPQPHTAVMLMAYGTPRHRDEIEPYYTDIRRGRPPTPEALADLVADLLPLAGPALPQRAQAHGVDVLPERQAGVERVDAQLGVFGQGGEDLGLWVGRAVGQPRLAVLDHRVQAVGGQGHGRQLGSPQRDAPAQPQLTGDGGVEVVEQVRHPRRVDAGRQSTVGHHTADLLAAFEDADTLALSRQGGCSRQAIVAGANDDGVKRFNRLLPGHLFLFARWRGRRLGRAAHPAALTLRRPAWRGPCPGCGGFRGPRWHRARP